MTIAAPLYRRTPLSLAEARWLSGNAPGPYKITMASPTMVAGFWRPGISATTCIRPRRDAVAALADIYRQDIADLLDAGVSAGCSSTRSPTGPTSTPRPRGCAG
ncbi:hypothetical protein ACRAWF_45910 [Streptomyces sp. L7]